MRRLGTALICAFVAWGNGAARAGETYPTGVRTITATTATSTCIGEISTPVCALETRFACIARNDERLCSLAQLPGKGDVYDQTYRILGYAVLRARDGRSPMRAEITVQYLVPAYDGLIFYSFEQGDKGWFHHDSAQEGEWGEEIYVNPTVTEVVEAQGRILIAPPPPGWK